MCVTFVRRYSPFTFYSLKLAIMFNACVGKGGRHPCVVPDSLTATKEKVVWLWPDQLVQLLHLYTNYIIHAGTCSWMMNVFSL